MAGPTYDIEPGYEFRDEMAVEADHMGGGALQFALVAVAILVVIVIATINWAKVEGQRASLANNSHEIAPALRMTRAEATQKLNSFGVVDEGMGVYRIPIDRAMALEIEDQRGDN